MKTVFLILFAGVVAHANSFEDISKFYNESAPAQISDFDTFKKDGPKMSCVWVFDESPNELKPISAPVYVEYAIVIEAGHPGYGPLFPPVPDKTKAAGMVFWAPEKFENDKAILKYVTEAKITNFKSSTDFNSSLEMNGRYYLYSFRVKDHELSFKLTWPKDDSQLQTVMGYCWR